MIEVLVPARFKKIEYLIAECESCGAVLQLTEEDRDPSLQNNGIFCPECRGFISQFRVCVEKININRS